MAGEVKLTPKQKAFCREYMVDRNATQAAIRAGYSETTANEQGSQNLAKLSIAAEIERLTKEQSERTEITADRVLKELALIGFYDPSRVFRVDKETGLPVMDFTAATEEDWRVVAEVSNETVKEGKDGDRYVTKAKIKHHCKLVALDKIARHLGLFNDKTTVTHDLSKLTDAQLQALASIQQALGG